LGAALVAEGRIGHALTVIDEVDRPLLTAEPFLECPGREAAVLFLLLEFDRDPRSRIGARVPRTERFEVSRTARDAACQGELDGALDRALAGLVRPADDRDPGGQIDVELAVSPQVADLQPADPHSETSWPASRSRPRRNASRSSAASPAGSPAPAPAGTPSNSAIRASRSRMNAPAIVSGEGSAPSV